MGVTVDHHVGGVTLGELSRIRASELVPVTHMDADAADRDKDFR